MTLSRLLPATRDQTLSAILNIMSIITLMSDRPTAIVTILSVRSFVRCNMLLTRFNAQQQWSVFVPFVIVQGGPKEWTPILFLGRPLFWITLWRKCTLTLGCPLFGQPCTTLHFGGNVLSLICLNSFRAIVTINVLKSFSICIYVCTT